MLSIHRSRYARGMEDLGTASGESGGREEPTDGLPRAFKNLTNHESEGRFRAWLAELVRKRDSRALAQIGRGR